MITKDYEGLKNYYVYGRGRSFYTENLDMAKREFVRRKEISGQGDYLALGVDYDSGSDIAAVDILIYSKGILRISNDYKYSTQSMINTLSAVVTRIKKLIG